MLYYIDYGTGAGNETVDGTLDDAKKEADEGVCYTQTDCCIYEGKSKSGEPIATRRWWSYDPTEEDLDDDIIQIGGGFYGAWQ